MLFNVVWTGLKFAAKRSALLNYVNVFNRKYDKSQQNKKYSNYNSLFISSPQIETVCNNNKTAKQSHTIMYNSHNTAITKHYM